MLEELFIVSHTDFPKSCAIEVEVGLAWLSVGDFVLDFRWMSALGKWSDTKVVFSWGTALAEVIAEQELCKWKGVLLQF